MFDALPYFPYYLNPDPAFRHMEVFYYCLADLDALSGDHIVLSHDSIVKPVAMTLVSLAVMCESLTGEDHEQIGRDMLSAWPLEYVDWLMNFAKEIIERAD